MSKFKILTIAGTIIVVAIIIAMMYVVTNRTRVNAPITEQSDINPAEQTTKIYTNSEHGFLFVYPNILKLGLGDFTNLPYGNYQQVLNEITLTHEIPVEYCALSGVCRPTTQDFGLSILVINSTLSDVQKALGGSTEQLPRVAFGNHTAIMLNQGVEGEGINYYFLATPNDNTLMFAQRFIDENTLINYMTEPDFLPLREQNTITSQIISSLKFTN